MTRRLQPRATAEDALAFVREHGVVLVSAKGTAPRFAPAQLAEVRQEHTPTGRHVNRVIPFPQWVPPDVTSQAESIAEQDAVAVLGAWISQAA